MKPFSIFFVLFLAFFLNACNNTPPNNTAQSNSTIDTNNTLAAVKFPAFNADSALAMVQRQVAFGPRVPGTAAHAQCATWLFNAFKVYTPAVQIQKSPVIMFNNKTVDCKNIIASFNPSLKRRVLLSAHWDSRQVADQDAGNKNQAIDGANDGGSGVAVLLEIARLLAANPLPASASFGVDIVLFDVEDQGTPDNMGYERTAGSEKTWCLGSQYWAANRHNASYSYIFGVLLDMVGAKDAIFPVEYHSNFYAPRFVQGIWAEAAALGYSSLFVQQQGGAITDDHFYINTIANIPTVDIIHYEPNGGRFGSTWHTQADKLENIDKNTLQKVGNTLLSFLFRQAANAAL